MNDTYRVRQRWLLVSFLCLSIFVGALAFNYDPQLSGESVLSTLARAQTGIFAIVFSVVVLGVQLSTSQYAPRLATNFTSDPAYRWTVGIFGASIGLNVLGLFAFGELSSVTQTFLLSLSIAVAVGAFLTLYRFVSDTLEKTTPEGILRDIKDRMTPEKMLAEINDSAEDVVSPDPFLALISVIHSFIANKDRTSASQGLDILAGRVSALIAFNGDEEIAEDSPLDSSLEILCTNQIPNTVEEAIDHDLTQIGLKVSESVETIGEATIEQTADRAFGHVITGHIDLIDTLGFESADERIRTEVIDTCKDLLKEAADNGLWASTATGTRILGWVAAASLMARDQEDGRNTRYGSLLILCFPKLLRTAVDSYATIDDLSPQDWLRVQMRDVHPMARLINSCYGSMAELTSAAIRYEMRTGQQIVDWSSVAYGWTEGVRALERSNLVEMQQLWLGTLLYLEYLESISPDYVMKGFDPVARHEISKPVGEATIDGIENGNIDAVAAIEFRPGRANPVEMPLTGHRIPIISDPDTTFTDWISTQPFLFGRGRFAGRTDPNQ